MSQCWLTGFYVPMRMSDKLIKDDKIKLARNFNPSYRYIDDFISFNNRRYREFISDITPKNSSTFENFY